MIVMFENICKLYLNIFIYMQKPYVSILKLYSILGRDAELPQMFTEIRIASRYQNQT